MRPLLVVILALIVACGGDAPQEGAISHGSLPRIPEGGEARLQGSIPRRTEFAILQDHVAMVSSEGDLGRLTAALNAGDQGGRIMQELLEERVAFGVPNGTDVTVLKHGTGGTHVRIAEPGRIYSGRDGWVPTDWVVPRPHPAGADRSLPSYQVLEKLGASIDVLVPTLSTTTPSDSLSRILLAIALREGAARASFYRTREAYRANVDGGRDQRAIDRAMKRGYLGSAENGVFQPTIY